MDLEKELAKLEADYQVKRAELATKYAVLSTGLAEIAEGYEPPFVHFSKLYGSVGSIHFNHSTYSRKGINPDAKLFRALLDKFPPSVPVIRVKDGCTSFRPDVLENNKDGADIYECYGITIRIEVFQGPNVTFQWFTTINAQLWRMEITFPLYKCDIGTLNARANRVGDHVTSWDVCEFHANAPAQKIRWASGGSEYPNSFTLYYDRDSGAAIDFPGLIKEK